MTVHEPGKIPSISHTTDSVHDADAQDPSITCELTLIDGEWVITSINQTTAEHVAQVTFADATGNIARAEILDAIRAAQAEDPNKPSIYLTVSPAPRRHGD
jgi:hypothetical protein